MDAIDRVKQELKIGEGVMETVRIEFEPFISEGARTVHRERRRHAQYRHYQLAAGSRPAMRCLDSTRNTKLIRRNTTPR